MNVFDSPDFDHHEQVAFFDDKETGLQGDHRHAFDRDRVRPAAARACILMRATDDALTDVLRLSRGMSYKNAIADLPLGGGKAVIIGDPGERQERGAARSLMPTRSTRSAAATSPRWMSASVRRTCR